MKWNKNMRNFRDEDLGSDQNRTEIMWNFKELYYKETTQTAQRHKTFNTNCKKTKDVKPENKKNERKTQHAGPVQNIRSNSHHMIIYTRHSPSVLHTHTECTDTFFHAGFLCLKVHRVRLLVLIHMLISRCHMFVLSSVNTSEVIMIFM